MLHSQVIVQKLSEQDDTKAAVLQFGDQIMETLLRIFQFRSATVSWACHELGLPQGRQRGWELFARGGQGGLDPDAQPQRLVSSQLPALVGVPTPERVSRRSSQPLSHSALIHCFASPGQPQVHEEAMLAVGAFTYAVGKQFNKYLPQFSQYLKTGLTNYLEWQVSCLREATWPGAWAGCGISCLREVTAVPAVPPAAPLSPRSTASWVAPPWPSAWAGCNISTLVIKLDISTA